MAIMVNNGDGKTGDDSDGKKDDGETGGGGDGGGAPETDALTSGTQAVIEIVTSPFQGDYNMHACYIIYKVNIISVTHACMHNT